MIYIRMWKRGEMIGCLDQEVYGKGTAIGIAQAQALRHYENFHLLRIMMSITRERQWR